MQISKLRIPLCYPTLKMEGFLPIYLIQKQVNLYALERQQLPNKYTQWD